MCIFRFLYYFCCVDKSLLVKSVGNTVEVTVELPGADEITVILRDANQKRWTKHGRLMFQ